MTLTDQAFIRAYGEACQDDRGELATTSPAGQSILTPTVTAPEDGSAAPARRFRHDRGGATTPSPVAIAVPLRDVLESLHQATATANIDPDHLDGPVAVDPPHTTRQPLSSFGLPGQEIAQTSRPGMTVSALRWPTLCHHALQQYASEYDRVVDTVLESADEGRSLIAITSSRANMGNTTTLLCLARQLAARGKTVAVVEANFVNPQLATLFELEPQATWQDVLCRGVAVADALIGSESDGIALLPASAERDLALDRALGLQASMTAGVVRFGYDVALVDLGPLGESTKLAKFLIQTMRIDAATVLSDQSAAEAAPGLTQVATELSDAGCQLLGIIENLQTA